MPRKPKPQQKSITVVIDGVPLAAILHLAGATVAAELILREWKEELPWVA